MNYFDLPLRKIISIGESLSKKLESAGIKTIGDVLFYFPIRYDDLTKLKDIKDVRLGEEVVLKGKILQLSHSKTFKKNIFITEALVSDNTGSIRVIWFNQPYLKNVLREGGEYYFFGKIYFDKKSLYLSTPFFEEVKDKQKYFGKIFPVYKEIKNLPSRQIANLVKKAIEKIPELKDYLPDFILEREGYPKLKDAFEKIHFPSSVKEAELAIERFKFEQVFSIILLTLKIKYKISRQIAPVIKPDIDLIKKFLSTLNFNLTLAQKKAIWIILKDLEKPRPMNRLLEGDVGSGKTIVALTCALNCIKQGYQVAFMVPTEVLAKQHFKTAAKLFADFGVNIGLLTGREDKFISEKLKNQEIEISERKLLQKTEKGEIDILIGTHTLIQDKVKFARLGFIILDEQHRFGVEQRAKLAKSPIKENGKILIPHLLSMTATPIPRTLALTIYGDLDVVLLDQLPEGRKKVVTKVFSNKDKEKALEIVKEEVLKGNQCFVICPRIEEKEKKEMELVSVNEEYEFLKKRFPKFNIAKIHSKLKKTEKEKIMQDFRDRNIDILVSTSVVEVGVDIPKATCILIENAERFGLAQLHQFRGRVGRSDLQSFCLLITDKKSLKTLQRIKAILESKNSFELAEKDLQIRGPGDFIGKKQSGMPDIAMQALSDRKLVEKAREYAKELLEKDLHLKNYPYLRSKLVELAKKIHFE